MKFDDRGDIILGWFTRVAAFLLLLGIIAFEGVSLVSARVRGADLATTVAAAAADAYAPRKNGRAAFEAAERTAIENDALLVADEFVISDDGSVDIAIETTATTLFLYRTDSTAKWAVVKSSAKARGANR